MAQLIDASGVIRFEGTIPELATDTVVAFEQTAGASPLFPIVAVGASTVTVAGDKRAFLLALDINEVTIVGSTGNDGTYDLIGDATYDLGLGTTTATLDAVLPSAVADGSVQPLPRYLGQVVLPPNSAVEWVYVITEVAWNPTDELFLLVGDDDDPRAFSDGSSGFYEAHTWQWPLRTLNNDPDTDVNELLVGTRTQMARYPAGATISVVLIDNVGDGGTGSTTVIVHHHSTETAAGAKATA